jgi:PI4-kinase N-terminal region
MDLLLVSVHDEIGSTHVNDPAWVAIIRNLYQKTARDWITNALSFAPCTTQGLLQVQPKQFSVHSLTYFWNLSYLISSDLNQYTIKILLC